MDSFLNHDLTVTNKTTTGLLDVLGASSLKDTLEVIGDATFKADAIVEQNLSVSGNGKVRGTFEVIGFGLDDEIYTNGKQSFGIDYGTLYLHQVIKILTPNSKGGYDLQWEADDE